MEATGACFEKDGPSTIFAAIAAGPTPLFHIAALNGLSIRNDDRPVSSTCPSCHACRWRPGTSGSSISPVRSCSASSCSRPQSSTTRTAASAKPVNIASAAFFLVALWAFGVALWFRIADPGGAARCGTEWIRRSASTRIWLFRAPLIIRQPSRASCSVGSSVDRAPWFLSAGPAAHDLRLRRFLCLSDHHLRHTDAQFDGYPLRAHRHLARRHCPPEPLLIK